MLTSKFYISLLLFLFICGCKKPIDAPENLDPIYLDLVSEIAASQKEIDSKKKELLEAETYYSEIKSAGPEKKMARDDVFRLKKEISLAIQNKKYFEYSAESRKAYSRKEYADRYKKNLPWPNTESFALYKKNKALMAAEKSWTRGYASKNKAGTSEKGAEKDTKKPSH